MANIKQITLPSGTTYDIVDQGARDLIEELSGYTAFLGVTTTALTDGSTTNPITIGGQSVTAVTGNIVTYGSKEFIFNGTAWQEFGDLSALGDLAYADTASASYKPAGSVSVGTTTATPTITLSAGTSSNGYQVTGSVSTPTITVTPSTTTVNSITEVGTLPTFTATVENENLTLGFSQGTLPTKGANVTVATGIQSASATQPTFTGGYVKAASSAVSTPTGSGSFAGTQATITVQPD